MRVTRRSRLAAAAAALALAGGAGAFVATRPEAALTDGSLRVTPAALALRGATPGTLAVGNRGATPITIEVAGPSWVVVDPAGALVAPGRSAQIVVRAIAEAPAGDAAVKITAGIDAVSVPVTVSGEISAGAGFAGPKLRVDGDVVDFGRTLTAIERTIANPGSESLMWAATEGVPWLDVEPVAGTIAPGAFASVRLSARRGQVSRASTGSVSISSNGGTASWDAAIDVGDGPLLDLPVSVLDFGVGGRTTVRTKAFAIRNEGRTALRYQASVDRAFLRLGVGASGTVAPGATARVEVTFDYSETRASNEWVAVVPISSDGGSAVLRVEGVSDWSGPRMIVGSNQMKFFHDHCSEGSCERFRHLRATVEDRSKVILVEAAFRVCTGSGETPTCDEWRPAGKARRVSGDVFKGVYEVEIGPLTKTCIPGVGVIVHYRLKLADALRNSVLRPGSSTYYGYLHCSRAT